MKTMLLRLVAVLGMVFFVSVLVTSCMPSPPIAPVPNIGWLSFFWFPVNLIGIAIYFLPIIIGLIRRKKNMLGIVLLNVLAGWTFIGWIIALVWSFTPDK